MNKEQEAKQLIAKGERPDLRTTVGKIWKSLVKGNIGDAVSEVTSSVGIEKCAGCEERQARWNKTNEHVSEEDYAVLHTYFNKGYATFDDRSEYIALVKLNNKYFPKSGMKPSNCLKCREKMLNRLKTLL